ncbi:hypothetical protein ACFV6F_05815 [Kitasatospora phosalacinea]|uniref:hypothetical protein n=1 Tax=Kitasatospora phosalacinea TaxID=2065 RepID=UPI00365BECBD
MKYANDTKGYGNGEYGATWETDNHADHSATAYATNLLQYASAMKAVDPTAKIGAVPTTPGSWPDGITGPGDPTDWNHTVLSVAGPAIDFAVVHHYPIGTSEADLLAKPRGEIPARPPPCAPSSTGTRAATPRTSASRSPRPTATWTSC